MTIIPMGCCIDIKTLKALALQHGTTIGVLNRVSYDLFDVSITECEDIPLVLTHFIMNRHEYEAEQMF